MVSPDVVMNKILIIERCLKRIEIVYQPQSFRTDFTEQDSVILNLQRACEASIDLANHVIKQKQLGLPQGGRDSFGLLARNSLLTLELAESLQKMVGLRNIAVHDYQELSLDVVEYVIANRLVDFSRFIAQIRQLLP